MDEHQDEPYVKLTLYVVPCFVVRAYKPVQTKEGHFVWRFSHDVYPVMELDRSMRVRAQLAEKLPDEFRHLVHGSIHNAKLTEEETIKALGDLKS